MNALIVAGYQEEGCTSWCLAVGPGWQYQQRRARVRDAGSRAPRVRQNLRVRQTPRLAVCTFKYERCWPLEGSRA